MNESVWETFDILYKTVHAQGRRVEELEQRVTELERRLRDLEPARPALRAVEPTPADEAWNQFGN